MKKTSPPPIPGTTKPRNDFGGPTDKFGPRELMAALDILSRRQLCRTARLSPVSRLRGMGGAA